MVGSFSADVELFVIRGSLTVGRETVGDQEYVGMWRDGVVPGIRVTAPGIGLLMTSAPVKYDTAAGGAPANALVGRPSTLEWESVAGQPGRFVRRIGTGPRGDVWMGGAVEWSQRDGPGITTPTMRSASSSKETSS